MVLIARAAELRAGRRQLDLLAHRAPVLRVDGGVVRRPRDGRTHVAVHRLKFGRRFCGEERLHLANDLRVRTVRCACTSALPLLDVVRAQLESHSNVDTMLQRLDDAAYTTEKDTVLTETNALIRFHNETQEEG